MGVPIVTNATSYEWWALPLHIAISSSAELSPGLAQVWGVEPAVGMGNVHWTFTECSLNVHWMLTECSLNVHWMFIECSLNVHWMFTECSLNIRYMITECSLNVHCMFTECSPNFTECSPDVYWKRIVSQELSNRSPKSVLFSAPHSYRKYTWFLLCYLLAACSSPFRKL